VRLLTTVLVALVLAPAAVATTSPSARVTIVVRISDKGIAKLAPYQMFAANELVPLAAGAGVPRGDIATFHVTNDGKKPHDFTILGRKTRKLMPGRKASFNVLLTTRGRFSYSSTLDRGKRFRGYLSVV
jgi:hypothetical protein